MTMAQADKWKRRRARERPFGRRAALLVALAAVSASLALALQLAPGSSLRTTASASVVEPGTGESFPAELDKQPLVATGVRRKYGAVKVYAVGLYLDRASKLFGKSPSASQLLKAAPGQATLRLVISSRLVTQAKLASALQESVEPRLQVFTASKGKKSSEVKEVIQEFGDVFLKGPALKKGTVIIVKLGKSGIEVKVGGKYKAEVKSMALTQALLATYVDSKAVVPEFREAILEELKA